MLNLTDYKNLCENVIFDEVCSLLGTKSEYYSDPTTILQDFSEIEVKMALDHIEKED